MSNDSVQPSTIDGIKRLANQIKKAEGISHARALDKASQAAKYQNYPHARRDLSAQALIVLSGHDLYISVLWRDRETGSEGQEVLKIRILTPLDEILRLQMYSEARNLSTMRREVSDHISATHFAQSRSAARQKACAAARTFSSWKQQVFDPQRRIGARIRLASILIASQAPITAALGLIRLLDSMSLSRSLMMALHNAMLLSGQAG
jgi:hypothetical protein